MDTYDNKPVKVALDYHISEWLDHYRGDYPSINRQALVNMILLDWLRDKHGRNR